MFSKEYFIYLLKSKKYLLLFISNVFFFFLCSTKWNAGYSISAGLAVLVIVWGRFQLNKGSVTTNG